MKKKKKNTVTFTGYDVPNVREVITYTAINSDGSKEQCAVTISSPERKKYAGPKQMSEEEWRQRLARERLAAMTPQGNA
jgi:hypothetical protein